MQEKETLEQKLRAALIRNLFILLVLSNASYAEDKWFKPDQSIQQGEVEVRIKEIKIGKVPLTGDKESEDELFMISLEISNCSSTKKVDYVAWGNRWGGHFGRGRFASLTDEAGNVYKRCTFGLSEIVGQIEQGESIYPKKTISDRLVFEVPTESCDTLLLELPAENFEEEGSLKIKIPRSAWDEERRKEEERTQAVESIAKMAEKQKAETSRRKENLMKLRWRTWTSGNGKYSVKAAYVESITDEYYNNQRDLLWEKMKSEEKEERKNKTWTQQPWDRYKEAVKKLDSHVTVVLVKEDRKLVKVTKDRLSDKDKEWVEEFEHLRYNIDHLKNWPLKKIVRDYNHCFGYDPDTDSIFNK